MESYKSALGTLVPLLQKEPKGPRRDLLYAQIKDWMDEAENIKALIDAHEGDSGDHVEDHHACVIQ